MYAIIIHNWNAFNYQHNQPYINKAIIVQAHVIYKTDFHEIVCL